MSENKNYEIKIFEVGIDNKKPVFDFRGSLKRFDMRKFQKRIDDMMDTKYIMRCLIASFCYGFYVRMLF